MAYVFLPLLALAIKGNEQISTWCVVMFVMATESHYFSPGHINCLYGIIIKKCVMYIVAGKFKQQFNVRPLLL